MTQTSGFEKTFNHYVNLINGVVSAIIIALLIWVGTEVASLGKEQAAMKEKSELMWGLVSKSQSLPIELAATTAALVDIRVRLDRLERMIDRGSK